MINDNFSLITPEHYFKNIERYQFQSLLPVENKYYYDVLLKDFKKDYYSELVDRGEEDSPGSNSFLNYRSASDYFILDRNDLAKYLNPVLVEFYMDLVNYLDTDENEKFQMMYGLIRSGQEDYIVKVKRTPRMLNYYPIFEEELEEMIMLIGGYEYHD